MIFVGVCGSSDSKKVCARQVPELSSSLCSIILCAKYKLNSIKVESYHETGLHYDISVLIVLLLS